ncbi:zinc finger, CCHC-type containing protein [Tanacetum coccineum]
MENENPIRTLGDYSKPSHEGYRNTIELPVGNNVVPLRSDTIRLVQNGCSFHGLRSEDPNQHLKDFLKLVDSLDLDVANRERTRLRLFQFSLRDQASNWLERLPAGSISTWEDLTTRFLAQFFPPGRTAKLRNDILMFQQHQGESLSEAWTRFKDLLQKVPHHGIDLWLQELARYEDEGWNDPVVPEKESLNYKNLNLEQLLGIMKYKVRTLMEEAIALMGRSESMFGISSNIVLPLEPSCQEAFEDLVMNFILDQEERVKQLEEYMRVIRNDFISVACRYDPDFEGISFRLGGEPRKMSLLEFGWRVGLYSEEQSRVKLAHRCIATTISGRKESTQRIASLDLFFLYCIYGEGVTCNIPYWLARYLEKVKEKDLLVCGMFVTKIAKSFRLLTNLMVDALSVEPRAHVFKKKFLIAMGIVMDLGGGTCCWTATRQVREDDEVEEATNEEAGGSTEVYRNMSRGDWQVRQARWMDQHDERWGQLNTWMGRPEEQAN